jgi:hypothetical protein
MSRMLHASLLLLIPLLLFLSQCKPTDPTPPIPKAATVPSLSIPSPPAQTDQAASGLGARRKNASAWVAMEQHGWASVVRKMGWLRSDGR